MKKAIAAGVCWFLLGGVAFAQAAEREQPDFVPHSSIGISQGMPSSGLRLIDPSRLHNYNQFIFSMSTSARSAYQGLYLSTFEYRLARPLDLSVTLGAGLTPGSGSGYSSQGQFFLSNMRLTYRPSESTLIQFVYQDPRGVVPYYFANPLANRWWYRER